MAHPNDELIQRFYAAFAARDGDAMAACYTADVTFHDPVFEHLEGAQPGAMWRMLTGRAEDLEIHLLEHEADDAQGSAHWLADYTLAATGNPVRNDVRARFRFRDGLICEHVDTFSFYRWARQGFGWQGTMLGWTPMIKNPVRAEARLGLERFMAADAQP